MIDWCCFYYFLRNSLVALLEALLCIICRSPLAKVCALGSLDEISKGWELFRFSNPESARKTNNRTLVRFGWPVWQGGPPRTGQALINIYSLFEPYLLRIQDFSVAVLPVARATLKKFCYSFFGPLSRQIFRILRGVYPSDMSWGKSQRRGCDSGTGMSVHTDDMVVIGGPDWLSHVVSYCCFWARTDSHMRTRTHAHTHTRTHAHTHTCTHAHTHTRKHTHAYIRIMMQATRNFWFSPGG